MQYAKAVYYDFTFAYPKGVFANNNGDYEKFRMYALGKQPISPYKKLLGVDAQTNHTWLSVDWTNRAVVSSYRDKAISRLMKEDFGVICTPIDMLARTEMQEYYNQLRIKLVMREQLQKENPELVKKVRSMIAVSNMPKKYNPAIKNPADQNSEFEAAVSSIVKDKYSKV